MGEIKKNTLGSRMRMYEDVTDTKLYPRTPVIMRIDGKAFHTFTRGLDRPWDEKFNEAMRETAKELCSKIQGAKFAYVQSDEISILITDYDDYNTERWFDYRIQKMVSVAASIATYKFNSMMQPYLISKGLRERFAAFDARVSNRERGEVINYFIWRQQDATRNSIQSLAQANFSCKETHGLKSNELQNKLLVERDINWNDTEVWKRRGACIVKNHLGVLGNDTPIGSWNVDLEPPIFSDNRGYIDRFVNPQLYVGYIDEINISKGGNWNE